MKTTITAPAGMYGLACEPWSAGEVYAVAANWAEASCPVHVYGGDDEWTPDEHGRQVADFAHRPAEAMTAIIEEAIIAGGGTPDPDEVASIVADAEELCTD